MHLKLLLEELCLVHDFLLRQLLGLHERLGSGFRRDTIPSRSLQRLSQKLLVEEVLDPSLPLEEGNVHFESSLVQLHGVYGTNGVHVGAVELDALASQGEELLHGVAVEKVVDLTLVFEAELR